MDAGLSRAACHVILRIPLNTTSENGVRWGKVEKEIASFGADISGRVAVFIAKQSVALKVAYDKGFRDVQTVRFISTQKVGAVATAREL